MWHNRRMQSETLLAWYDRQSRDLPWRVPPPAVADPYRVWLSEIMLQQTRAATVVPYYRRFVERWPDVGSLASASSEDVLEAWAGLGYYARAKRLHECARIVVERHGGRFPEDLGELRGLPGIGEYTGAAIAAIAFGVPAAAVDGNVERVMARLHAVETPLPAARPQLRDRAREIVPAERAGDFAQAMMELGATVCLPRNPRCGECPWAGDCRGRAEGSAGQLPRRTKRKPRPVRHGVAFRLRRQDGAVLLVRRPREGLLGGMLELPGTGWSERRPGRRAIDRARPATGRWRRVGVVRHAFSHFALELEVRAADCATGESESAGVAGCWVSDLERAALPSVMRKALRL